MAMETIFDGHVPGVWNINGMFVGKSISVYGVVNDNPTRIDINLLTDKEDIAFHFNPRFHEKQVVRNTMFQSRGWGEEEREGDFPFNAGKRFYVEFICEPDHFRVRANSFKTYVLYKHRIPFSEITKLQVLEDCQLKVISNEIAGAEVLTQGIPSPASIVEVPYYNLRTHSVVVIGKPTSSDGRFKINFLHNDRKRIFFHFNPRMGESQIIRNSNEGDEWGNEEKDLDITFPFTKGVPFLLKFHVEKKWFRVELDGINLLVFHHRVKHIKQIRYVQIGEDVEIDKIQFF